MRRIILAGQVGFTYIGTVVGAGFASGQEIFQFFSIYGFYGTLGVLLSILLFTLLGIRMMLLGARLGARSYQDFNLFLFGSRWGPWMNALVGLTLFSVITAMLSGTGALAKEQLGLSFHAGVLFTIILSYLVMIKGMDGILSINSLVVPAMLFFSLVLLWQACTTGDGLLYGLLVDRGEAEGNWILSALSYVAFNLAMSQAVLVPMGGAIGDETILRLGGWIGGLGLGLMLLIYHLDLQFYFSEVKGLQVPIATMVGTLGSGFKYLFMAVLWGEIFTTVIGNVYGLASHLRQMWGWQLHTWVLLLFVVAYLCSLVGFPTIIRYLYPFFGYCSFTLLLLLVGRRMPQT